MNVLTTEEVALINESAAIANGNGRFPPPSSTILAKPKPLDEAAFYGLAGEIVRAIEPQSEADPAALLVATLVETGNAMGRDPHVRVEAHSHTAAEFCVVVGETSKARKGTGEGRIRNVLRRADEVWAKECVTSGAVSGEGIAWEVRDEIVKPVPVKVDGKATGEFRDEIVDQGVGDKRRLWRAGEFASILKAGSREGNTLTATLREAWDGEPMRGRSKNSPFTATDHHTSILADVTRDELRRLLTDTDVANGFANRFLFVCAHRSKVLPRPRPIPDAKLDELAGWMGQALRRAGTVGELDFDPDAEKLWCQEYERLSEGRPGMLGAVTSRGEAHVIRLSLIYALLDEADSMRVEHLRAALAVWAYCFNSARYLFGKRLGHRAAERILAELEDAADGLSRTEIRDLLGHKIAADEIATALQMLADNGLAWSETVPTIGRPQERWYATAVRAKTVEQRGDKGPKHPVDGFPPLSSTNSGETTEGGEDDH